VDKERHHYRTRIIYQRRNSELFGEAVEFDELAEAAGFGNVDGGERPE